MDDLQTPSPDAPVALTSFSSGAGCGCKVAPAVLHEMLHTDMTMAANQQLLVGNDSNDDAAVYLLNDEQALITTTDFFTPIVDDAFTYGQVAAANAISDVYAMGGTPLVAIAILGWPVDVLPASLAGKVLDGARTICAEAGIPLAGGHSVAIKEPIFGLSVNGLVHPKQLKRNDTAQVGDVLLMTKPLGTGILSTAQKRQLIQPEELQMLIAQLIKLNSIGAKLGTIEGVTAMTDITGFGLLGHLYEMAAGSGLSAVLDYAAIPVLPAAKAYAAQRIVPDATFRNWNNYSAQVAFGAGVNVMEAFNILPDPQTNGGLLIAVRPDALTQVQDVLSAHGYADFVAPIGHLIAKAEKMVQVN